MELDLKELRAIPGVGLSIARDLWELGYHKVDDLRGQDPESMYQRHMQIRGCHVDRCLLYVFRCAVYYASTEVRDPEKLKWWNWKDAA